MVGYKDTVLAGDVSIRPQARPLCKAEACGQPIEKVSSEKCL